MIVQIDVKGSVNVVLGLIPPKQVAPWFSRITTVLYGERGEVTTPDNCDWLGTNDLWEGYDQRIKVKLISIIIIFSFCFFLSFICWNVEIAFSETLDCGFFVEYVKRAWRDNESRCKSFLVVNVVYQPRTCLRLHWKTIRFWPLVRKSAPWNSVATFSRCVFLLCFVIEWGGEVLGVMESNPYEQVNC